MAAKVVTWLGEDVEPEDAYGQASPGPSFNMWQTIRFDKDKPVLIDDQTGDPLFRELKAHILAIAPSNQFYKVEEPAPEHKAEAPRSPPQPKAPPPKMAARR